jgi:hypothetical protein
VPDRSRSRTTAPVRATTPGRRAQASPPAVESADRRRVRTRLGLSASVSDHDLFAALLASLPKATPRTTPPRAATPPPVPPPAPPPLVSGAGPTEAELVEEAQWEEANARMFDTPLGPATRALAERGLPTPEQRRSAEHHARQAAYDEQFARAAEASRLAEVAKIDAARAAHDRASQESHERAQDRLHFPELNR